MVSENCRTTGVSLPERQWQRINQDRGQTLVSAFIQQIIDEHYNYKDKIESYQGSSNSNTSMTDNNGNLKKQEHWIQDGNGNVTAVFTQQFDYDSLLWGERQIRSVANMTRADARDFLDIAGRIGLRPKATPFPLNQVKGLKFRTSGKPDEAFVKALGGSAQVMAFSEVFGALQQGVVDGQYNSWSNIYTQKFHEVQKYATVSRGGALLTYGLATNAKWWDGLAERVLWSFLASDEKTGYSIRDEPSADRIIKKFQDLKVGDILLDGPPGTAYFTVATLEKNRVLAFYSNSHVR